MTITTTTRNARQYVRDIGDTLAHHRQRTPHPDEQIPLAEIVKVSGLESGLWCCRAEPQHAKEWRLFAVWCARQVQHLMTDPRSLAALDVAERFANGSATENERKAAEQAAIEAKHHAAWGTQVDVADVAQRTLFEDAGKAALYTQEALLSAVSSAKRDETRAKFLEIVG